MSNTKIFTTVFSVVALAATQAYAGSGTWMANPGAITLPPVANSAINTTSYTFDPNSLGGTASTPYSHTGTGGTGDEFFSGDPAAAAIIGEIILDETRTISGPIMGGPNGAMRGASATPSGEMSNTSWWISGWKFYAKTNTAYQGGADSIKGGADSIANVAVNPAGWAAPAEFEKNTSGKAVPTWVGKVEDGGADYSAVDPEAKNITNKFRHK